MWTAIRYLVMMNDKNEDGTRGKSRKQDLNNYNLKHAIQEKNLRKSGKYKNGRMLRDMVILGDD